MKNYLLLFTLSIFGFVLAGCAPTEETNSGEDTVEQIYTSVAMAFSTEAAKTAQAYTPASTSTLTPQATATLVPSITPISVTKVASTAVYSSATCDDSAYVSDVTIADGTVLAPGESFTKTWNFQNTGTCGWTTSYSAVFVSGSAMSGSTTYLTSSASSGGTLNVSVAMVAPTATGTYTGYWQLRNASGVSFGQSVYVQVVVSDSASTITPTVTATGDESAYTSTPTTAPTNTPVPTTIPTSTPAAATSATETPAT